MYHASKWALEGISQSLALEVADFGIKVTVVEPGGFSTDWGGSSARHATARPEYEGVREKSARFRAQRTAQSGDPTASSAAILKLVDAPVPPLRVFFGDGPLAIATADYETRLATWREWEWLSIEAGGHAS
jgi:NAD(P)-dependent dehydrogenase (short-subunit alcohol dehydrogenase family)